MSRFSKLEIQKPQTVSTEQLEVVEQGAEPVTYDAVMNRADEEWLPRLAGVVDRSDCKGTHSPAMVATVKGHDSVSTGV